MSKHHPVSRRPARRIWLLAGLAAPLLAAPLLAAPADQVRTRIAGYKDLGAAFKTLNDTLRAPAPQPAVLGAAARRIRNAATHQYHWYPAGSGPRAGIKTAAKAEIWTQGPRFRQLQDGFAAQAAGLERAVAGGNIAAIRSATRTLGGSCKACHDQFRTEDN